MSPERREGKMINYVGIIIEFATVSEIDRPFTYEVPETLKEKIKIGQRVKVPFGKGNRQYVGYVVEQMEEIEKQKYRLKAISKIIDEEPLLTKEQLDLVQFIVSYYGTSYAAAMDAVLPPGLKDTAICEWPSHQKTIKLNADVLKVKIYYESNRHKQSFTKQKWIMDYLRENGSVEQKRFEAIEEVSKSSLKTLIQKEIVIIEEEAIVREQDNIHYEAFKTLNQAQQEAVDYLKALQEADVYRTVLLQGVTGSGKTEVFLHGIKEVLEAGGTALVLVPEIALTAQTQARFEERFGNRVALTHSRMNPKERQRIYMQAKKGEVSIVIGPRSAVFMPLPRLKFIVIDEAHDSSYKSETEPKYHAVDIAKERMKRNNGQVLLATATPNLETYYEVQEGHYDLIRLDERVGGAALPEVDIVDMRLELSNGNHTVLSGKLYSAIEETLKQDKQVMLLINRRGHSTFINCRSCGYVVKCEHCDVSLTYHSSTQSLQCHYCGKTVPIPEVCPECGSRHIRYFGSGTEKVEAYINECFGEYGVGRMDTDTTTGKEGHRKILDAFRKKEIHVLIGTQMIAKGHDFPEVTLVGILSADASLFMEDFRSNERTYQLLTQAMGRAGRGEHKGRVIIQTYNPDHFVMDVVKYNKQDLFYTQELANRKAMGYPPYTHIFSVLVVGVDEGQVIRMIHLLAEYFRYYSEKGQNHFRVIGPTSAVISKIGDEFRWRLLILGEVRETLLIYGKYCLNKFYTNEKLSGVKVQWDINPQVML